LAAPLDELEPEPLVVAVGRAGTGRGAHPGLLAAAGLGGALDLGELVGEVEWRGLVVGPAGDEVTDGLELGRGTTRTLGLLGDGLAQRRGHPAGVDLGELLGELLEGLPIGEVLDRPPHPIAVAAQLAAKTRGELFDLVEREEVGDIGQSHLPERLAHQIPHLDVEGEGVGASQGSCWQLSTHRSSSIPLGWVTPTAVRRTRLQRHRRRTCRNAPPKGVVAWAAR
jgi:hypothetical protein